MKSASNIVLKLLSVLLLTAAVLKGWQLLTEPTANNDIWTNRAFLILTVEFEIALGIWLLSGLFKKAAWLATISCFSLFSFVSLYKGLSGAESCGCFGSVHVNPWITLFAIDIPAFIALAVFRPKGEGILIWPPIRRFATAAIIGVVILTIATPVLVFNEPAKSTSSYEVLEPKTWIGKELPILAHIDIAEKLEKGSWVVLFYLYDCPDCNEALRMCEQIAKDLAGNKGLLQIAIVEVPPYDHTLDNDISSCNFGHLSDSKEWFVTTPVMVLLDDKLVQAVWEQQLPKPEALMQMVATAFATNPEGHANAFEAVESLSLTSVAEFISVKPSAWNLGDITEGVFRKAFVIENQSNKPLMPVAKVDCSCLRILQIPSVIRPHETGRAEFEIDTRDLPNTIDKSILLYAAESSEKIAHLKVTGTIAGTVRCQSRFIDLGVVQFGEVKQADVVVFATGKASLNNCAVSVSDSRISAQVIPEHDNKYKAIVKIDYCPKTYPEVINADIMLVTREGPAISKTIHVAGKSVGDVEFQPDAIVLGRIGHRALVVHSLSVATSINQPLHLQIISTDLPEALSVSCCQETDNRWKITISGRCFLPQGSVINGYMHVKTNQPGCNMLRIPVLGVVTDLEKSYEILQ